MNATIRVIILSLIFSSCVSKKSITYFQKDQINQSLVTNKYKTIFKPDDLLQINISSSDTKSSLPFNLPIVSFSNTSGNPLGQPIQQNYLIDSKGEIDFPILGKLKIGGKSRESVIKMFKEKLSPEYILDPTINIFITNYKITVTGDVARPGTFTIPNERITLLEALGLAGDLNISAMRNNVKIIREENGQKRVYVVDLLSNEVFNSPVYYLQQNDLIYVEPNSAKAQSASANQNTALFVSVGSILISLLTIITR